jgi:methionyl-tRNA formyltransferase
MRTLRILFMGTPEFAVGILDRLQTSSFNIVGVVTAPDKPAGRGKQLKSSAVKTYALHHDLEVLQPTNLKSEDFQDDLKRLDPNLIIVVAFRMLPKAVWNFPDYGTFNLHASLLPQYRGAAPINWAIINGEKKTGVTTFFIDEEIDTGKIIDSKSISIAETDNVETLHDKLMTLGAEVVIETVKAIEQSKVEPQPQVDISELKAAPKLTKENTKIDWKQSGNAIVDFIRGLSPFPVAWTELTIEGEIKKIKVYKASYEISDHQKEIGSTHLNAEIKTIEVAVKNGHVHLEVLQFPGKKRMEVKALLNGMAWKSDYRFC